MLVKKSKAFLPKVAMFIFLAIVFVYTAYHLVNLFLSEDIETIISGVTTESDSVSGTGYVFREEILFTSGTAGAVDYFVADGEKIGVGQQIANVYGVSLSSNGILAKRMLFLTDKQISLLEKSVISGAEVTDLASLRKDAGDTYYKILNLISERDTSELAVQTENMMVTMNKMNVLTDGTSSVTKSLDALRAQRESYLVGEHMPQTSHKSGYFYYTPDGFESRFKPSALEDMTANEFYSLVHYYENTEPKIDSAVYGKLAETTVWYFAMPLSQKRAAALVDGNDYRLTFKENNNTTLTMTLEKRIEANSREESILIFKCNRLPDNFILDRCQNAEIEISSMDGIYVPLSAMKRVNGVRGVYVLRGSVVHFRKVDIIYNGADYCLVAESGEAEGNYEYLGTNELIITNGKNLFDGRILG
jgi:putative membrane fusion protein